MAEKPYKLGILVGRFQTVHTGHCMMIGKAAELCERVGIFVGSSQEYRTAKNPFTYEEREEMLRAVCPECVSIFPLPDIGVGNNARWGEYVLKNVLDRFGMMPELSVSGKEERRASWLEGELGAEVAELYVPKTIDISATAMREFFLRDDRAAWQSYTDERLWGMYDTLREAVIASKDNMNTKSI